MSENKKYTIIVKKQRVEVSEAVYRAYHKEREAERYQNKLIRQNELSLERFHEDGVNIDYLILKIEGILVPFFVEDYRFQNGDAAYLKFEDIDTIKKMVDELIAAHGTYLPKFH